MATLTIEGTMGSAALVCSLVGKDTDYEIDYGQWMRPVVVKGKLGNLHALKQLLEEKKVNCRIIP